MYDALSRPSADAEGHPLPERERGSLRPARYAVRRRDFAKVSNATASTMMIPMMICWM
jgi:hypothetical protein